MKICNHLYNPHKKTTSKVTRKRDTCPEDHLQQAHMQSLVEQNTMMLIDDFAIDSTLKKISAFAIKKT